MDFSDAPVILGSESPEMDVRPSTGKRKRAAGDVLTSSQKKKAGKGSGGKKAKQNLKWFVDIGLIKPAPKAKPGPDDASGFHYLKKFNPTTEDYRTIPYTVLLGRYKSDVRYFFLGKDSLSNDSFVLINWPDILTFKSPTGAPTHYIAEFQKSKTPTSGDRDLKVNKARYSGYEYLRFPPGVEFGKIKHEEEVTLSEIRNEISAELQPETTPIRDANDLINAELPTALDIHQDNFYEQPQLKTHEIIPEQDNSYQKSEMFQNFKSYLELPQEMALNHTQGSTIKILPSQTQEPFNIDTFFGETFGNIGDQTYAEALKGVYEDLHFEDFDTSVYDVSDSNPVVCMSPEEVASLLASVGRMTENVGQATA